MDGRKTFWWGGITCLIAFCCFVWIFQHAHNRNEQRRVQDHVLVIAEALWNLDRAGANEYLSLAARHEKDAEISVLDAQGRSFLLIEGPAPGFFDRMLLSVGLIQIHQLTEPILRQDKIIGELKIMHRNDTIYMNMYVAVVLGLMMLVYSLFLRTLASKQDLSKRVEARTAELMEAKDKLFHAQKMEAIGQLAGGVAHDFNNLLTAIIGHAELLEMGIDPDSEDAKYTGVILSASTRAADLTKQLLTFSRKGKLQTVNVDTHSIIKEVISLLDRSIDKRIGVIRHLKALPSIIIGDPTQLQSAILNLAINSRDAMPDGGELTFQTKNILVTEAENLGSSEKLPCGQYVEITVSDTGIGMDKELQKRIFEPFFTTKNQGEGTGLGLASVYGCVMDHLGSISVYSEPGQGSVFKVLLPVAPELAMDTNLTSHDLTRGHGHILIVDDEENVRQFTRKALTHLGYVVSECHDGSQAVEFFRQNHSKIDLVILDQIMPKLSGEEAFFMMKDIQADVRVLIASGYIQNGTVDQLLINGVLGFLPKPFRIGELAREVARCLV